MEHNARILIVDDEPAILKLIERILEPAGYEIIPAGDGASALKILESEHPDLVLLDIMMPGIDGYQVLHKIRGQLNIPVLILSAKSEAEDVQTALNLGADDYVRKPFRPLELLARIRAKLRRAGMQ